MTFDRDEAASSLTEQIGRLSVGSGLTARALEIFVTVARFGTMSAAAQHLGLSQPAVSQAILQIETALDVALFDRSKRPLVLTLQGAGLLEPARAVVSGIGRFENALRWGATRQLPRLRIGMLNSFAETIGPLVLSRLGSIAAELTVDSGFNATRVRSVADREFDFVVTTDESPPLPGIEVTPIMTEPFLIVVPASYDGAPDALKPLSQKLDLIRFGRDPFMISRFDQTLRAWGIAPNRRYQMDTHEAVLQMVGAGVGWTILPPLAVYRALGRGEQLRVAPYPEPSMKRTMMVISRTGEGSHVAAQIHEAATEALRARFLPAVAALMPEIAGLIALYGPDTPPSGRVPIADRAKENPR
jgi:DNA-binding transcriptional LysR family regulator